MTALCTLKLDKLGPPGGSSEEMADGVTASGRLGEAR